MKKPSLGLVLYVAWTLITLSWWALAFAPLQGAPEWLLRTRDVCFGTMPNGLPDTYGWMTLVLSPLSMLGAILVLWGAPLRADLRVLRTSRAGWVFLAVLFGMPAAGMAYVGHVTGKELRLLSALRGVPESDRLPAGYPRIDRDAADFKLVDQAGRTLAKTELEGKLVVMTFAYAHCATVCPLVIKTLNDTLASHGGADVVGVVVTLDPLRDTPGSLPTLAANWGLGKNVHLLSGAPDDVNKMLKDYNVATERDEKTGDIGHLAIFYILDESGRMVYAFNNPPPAWIGEALTRLRHTKTALN